MNKNQKIALGCGGAGCLGLIVVVIAGVLLFMFMGRGGVSNTNRRIDVNVNSNSAPASNANANTDENENNQSATDSSETSSSSISDDAKHRLFQAAGMVGDTATVSRVLKKIGLVNEAGTPNANYATFMKDHFAWALRNAEFIQSVNTKEKAQAYVDEHIDD